LAGTIDQGVTLNFHLYLKELVFRYNHRKEGIFELATGDLFDLAPEPDELPSLIYSLNSQESSGILSALEP
jgi:hypothetical protein